MGLFNLGGVIEAFAPAKTKKKYLSDSLQGQLDATTGSLGNYRSSIANTLGQYDLGMQENIGEQRRLNKLAESDITGLLSKEQNYDFLGDRERIRGGDLSALGGILGQLGGGMSKADKVAAARLGYAGRPSSSYLDKARASYLGSFAAPSIQQIFAGLNPGASAASNARLNSIAAQMGLLDARGSLPDRITDRILAPAQARTAFLNDEINALSGLGGAYRNNFAGYETRRNPWAQAVGAVDESLNSAVDIAASLYGGGGGGGMGGGLGGIFGGGLGGASGVFNMGNGGFSAGLGFGNPYMYGGTSPNPFGGWMNQDPRGYMMYSQQQQRYNPLWNPARYE